MEFTASQLAAAYAECETLARRHYENFPVASLILPRAIRRHVAAVYAFARTADDFADEPAYEGRRMERLSDWRRRLNRASEGVADDPIFIALAHTLSEHALPVRLMHDLITAFERDVTVKGYETFDEVLDYCRYSANPVGRLVLHLSGYRDEGLMVRSDAICTALQLTNFWQDVAIDREKGRCYLPREDMRRFRCDAGALEAGAPSPPFVELLRFQIGRTRALFARGADLPSAVGGRLGFELRLVVLGGLRVLDLIEKAGYDVFERRPSLRATDWGRLVMKATFLMPQGLIAAASR